MTRKDPFLALVLEVAGGFFGFPGIGWIYAGQVGWGLVFMIGYWLLDWALGVFLAIVTMGLWCAIWPAQNLIVGAERNDERNVPGAKRPWDIGLLGNGQSVVNPRRA
jgi:TM2 domain-containing membrane protein YozV